MFHGRKYAMSDHGHGDGHEHSAVAVSGGEHHAPPAPDLRFEKEELHFFEADDRGAGQHIGILLAFIFCILVVLMTGVTIWTTKYKSVGHDPHSIPSAPDPGGHH
jgi:hypothetical protein